MIVSIILASSFRRIRAYLSDESPDIDHEIEVHVNSRGGNRGIDNDPLSGWKSVNPQVGVLALFGDQWRDVRFESTGTDTHDDDSDSETPESVIRVIDNGGDSGGDEENMANHSDSDSYANGLITTPVGIGDVGAKQR